MQLVAYTTNIFLIINMNKNANPTSQIGFFIGRTHRTMINVLQQRLTNEGIDVTPEQGILLMHLGIEEGLSQQEIANRIFKDKSSVKRLIDSMESKSLLVRIEDKNDRRNKLIYLTHKGKKVKEEVIEVKSIFAERFCKEIDKDEMKVCKKVLSQIYEIFNEDN